VSSNDRLHPSLTVALLFAGYNLFPWHHRHLSSPANHQHLVRGMADRGRGPSPPDDVQAGAGRVLQRPEGREREDHRSGRCWHPRARKLLRRSGRRWSSAGLLGTLETELRSSLPWVEAEISPLISRKTKRPVRNLTEARTNLCDKGPSKVHDHGTQRTVVRARHSCPARNRHLADFLIGVPLSLAAKR
jgi:hypothetical protein